MGSGDDCKIKWTTYATELYIKKKILMATLTCMLPQLNKTQTCTEVLEVKIVKKKKKKKKK